MQREAFVADGVAVLADIGGDVNLEAGGAGGAGHRQAVRQEVPVLGHDVENARRRPREDVHAR